MRYCCVGACERSPEERDDVCEMHGLRAENERLRAALQEMLETHGKPHREEWINDAAFEHAKQVDARARQALTNT